MKYIFLFYVLKYFQYCLIWMLFTTTIQIICRKRMMSNWALIRHLKGDEYEKMCNKFPPIDGWAFTIFISFIPIANILYPLALTLLEFNAPDSDIIKELIEFGDDMEWKK